jgi:heptaprenyl diphosphate synthase
VSERISNQKIAAVGLLSAVAVLLGYVETLIPVLPPIAGIKLGLGNIAVLMALKQWNDRKTALGIMMTKVIVCSLLFSGIGALPYSLAGGIVSTSVMAILCRSERLSCAGVSACGGAAHMAAQTVVAALMTSTVEVFAILPVLTAAGILTGFLNGMVANMLCRLPKRI